MRKMVLCSSALLVLAFYSAGFANPVEQGEAYHYTVGVIRQESKSYYTAESAATQPENEKPATDETQQDKEAERREPNCEGGVCRI